MADIQMPVNIQVALTNASTVIKDEDVKKAVLALQQQLSRDFGPVWGIAASIEFFDKAPDGYWWLVVLDDSDQAGALGYHDVTSEGLPLGKIFAKTDLLNKNSWTVTASHELLEMLADPAINLTALVQTQFDLTQNVVGRLFAYEVCDPCESDADSYDIDGVLVSDFVYPAWFEPFRSADSQFDFQNRITAPFGLLREGYMQVYDMTSGTGWQQIFQPGANAAIAARAPVGSRRERRRLPRSQWVRSRPKSRTARKPPR